MSVSLVSVKKKDWARCAYREMDPAGATFRVTKLYLKIY